MDAIITVPFGYLLDFLYRFTSNYGVALILFAIILKLVLFPVAVTAAMFILKSVPINVPVESIILGVFVAFSMPTAGLAATFADEFGGERVYDLFLCRVLCQTIQDDADRSVPFTQTVKRSRPGRHQ